ncbi:MAG: ABC transporter permease [Anaerolineae bacterium]|nr:ABC transporter permease [Anaerolineae bacterium]
MLNYVIRRLITAFFLLIGVSMVSFIVIKLPPGDFATRYQQYLMGLGTPQEDAERAAENVRKQYGLDQPGTVQYYTWIKDIVTEGKFGYSLAYRRDVGELIKERLPRTILVAAMAHAISTIVGVGVGIYVATRKYGFADNLWAVISFVFTSVPRFSIAIILLYVLVIKLDQPSISSFFSPEYVVAPWSWDRVMDMMRHIWPAVLIAGLGGIARNLRVMRGNLLDVLGAQYVQTARSKGLSERTVIVKHATPNALHTIIAYQGTVLPYMMQGELEAAIVLGLPTMGPLFYESLVNQDIYISGSLLLMYGLLILIGNLLADIFLSMLDPRIRFT